MIEPKHDSQLTRENEYKLGNPHPRALEWTRE